jgi:starch synthase
MRVLLPAYRRLRRLWRGCARCGASRGCWGGPGRVYAGEVEGVDLLLLDAPHLYDREGGPYNLPGGDWPDNPQRFAALSWVAARIAREGCRGLAPQVLHAHDWQAGSCAGLSGLWRIGRGIGDDRAQHRLSGLGRCGMLDGAAPAARGVPSRSQLEYYGGLSSLKAGLVTADRITTVSPTYAAELMRPEFGMGLQGVIAARGRGRCRAS